MLLSPDKTLPALQANLCAWNSNQTDARHLLKQPNARFAMTDFTPRMSWQTAGRRPAPPGISLPGCELPPQHCHGQCRCKSQQSARQSVRAARPLAMFPCCTTPDCHAQLCRFISASRTSQSRLGGMAEQAPHLVGDAFLKDLWHRSRLAGRARLHLARLRRPTGRVNTARSAASRIWLRW